MTSLLGTYHIAFKTNRARKAKKVLSILPLREKLLSKADIFRSAALGNMIGPRQIVHWPISPDPKCIICIAKTWPLF